MSYVPKVNGGGMPMRKRGIRLSARAAGGEPEKGDVEGAGGAFREHRPRGAAGSPAEGGGGLSPDREVPAAGRGG